MLIVLGAMSVLLDRYHIKIGFLISYGAMVFLLLVLFETPLREAVFALLFALGIVMVMQMIGTGILTIFYQTINYNFTNGLLVNGLTILGCYGIGRLGVAKKMKAGIHKHYKAALIIATDIMALLLCILYVWQVDKNWVWDHIPWVIGVVCVWIFIHGYMLYQAVKLKEKEEQLLIHQRYLPFLKNLVDEVRAIQHEHSKHLNVMSGLVEIEDAAAAKEEIQAYLGGLIQHIKPVDKVLGIRDPVLSAVIYSKKSLAESKNIDFVFRIDQKIPEYPLETYELVEVLSNLLDNAVEAAEDSYEEGRGVVLTLGVAENKSYMEVKNTGQSVDHKNMDLIFRKGYSTKEGKHRGYGLYNVKKLVHQYQGNIELSFEDQKYTVFKISF